MFCYSARFVAKTVITRMASLHDFQECAYKKERGKEQIRFDMLASVKRRDDHIRGLRI